MAGKQTKAVRTQDPNIKVSPARHRSLKIKAAKRGLELKELIDSYDKHDDSCKHK